MGPASSPEFDRKGTAGQWHATPESRLAEIAARARTFTNADGAAIAVREGDVLVTRASTGGNAPDIGSHSRVEGSFTGLCLERGTALHCEDSDRDPRVNGEACRALETRSFIVVPVARFSSFEAVLAVFSKSAHAFSRTDVSVLKSMAAQVAHELEPAAVAPAANTATHPDEEPADEKETVVMETPINGQLDLAAFGVEQGPPESQDGAVEAQSPEADEAEVDAAIARLIKFPERPDESRAATEKDVAIEVAEPDLSNTELELTLANLLAEGSEAERHSRRPVWIALMVILVVAAAAGFWFVRKSQAAKAAVPDQSSSSTLSEPSEAPAQPSVATTEATPAPDTSVSPSEPVAKRSPFTPPRNIQAAIQQPVRSDPSLANLKPPSPGARGSETNVSGLQPSKLLRKVAPDFPPEAQHAPPGESVVLRATVLKDGTVGEVKVLQGMPVLAAPAVTAVKQWLYRPARLNGRATESTVDVVVKFDRNQMKF